MYRYFYNEVFRNGVITVACLVLIVVTAPRLFAARDAYEAPKSSSYSIADRQEMVDDLLDEMS